MMLIYFYQVTEQPKEVIIARIRDSQAVFAQFRAVLDKRELGPE
jgi:hypothetical protein